MPETAIRPAVWHAIEGCITLASNPEPGLYGNLLGPAERQALALITPAECQNLISHLHHLAGAQLAEALELELDLVPAQVMERRQAEPYQKPADPFATFSEAFPVTEAGGLGLTAAIEHAGGVDELARRWGVLAGLVKRRALAMVRHWPELTELATFLVDREQQRG